MADRPPLAKLRQQGYRLTPQRLAILRILRESQDHLTPVEIYQQAVRELPGITEPTVYRSLNFLVENGLVLASHSAGSQVTYEFADHAHHHLTCRSCGADVEIDDTLLEELYSLLECNTGFTIDSPHLTFFGLCPSCQETRPSG